MYLQSSQLIGRAVIAQDTGETLGTMRQLVIEPTNGRLLALRVQRIGWFGRSLLLATSDLIGVHGMALVTRDAEQLVELGEIVRAHELLEKKIPIIGQAARTVSGTRLGTVDDVLVDTETWMVTKYYLKQLFDERILPATLIHSITPKAVIFVDRASEPIPELETAEPAAGANVAVA